jgi:hypothetical protein
MELRANLSNEYLLYNALSYGGQKEEVIANYLLTETEFLNLLNNTDQRKFLLDQLPPDMKGGLLHLFLNHKYNITESPLWHYTILNYKHPVRAVHAETDFWVLNQAINLKSFHQVRLLQKRILEITNHELRVNVLCLGAKAVVGLPELGKNLSICCIESDENMLNELKAIYANEPGIRKYMKGDFQHYCPDRKHDVIIYPSGKTWQETEKMQDLLLKLKNYLNPDKGRVLAY